MKASVYFSELYDHKTLKEGCTELAKFEEIDIPGISKWLQRFQHIDPLPPQALHGFQQQHATLFSRPARNIHRSEQQ